MSLEKEVADIESALAKISTRLDEFERDAKRTINADQELMLHNLQAGVQSIQRTVGLLESGRTGPIGLLTFLTSARPELSVDAVAMRSSEMSSRFRQLRDATETALSNTKRIGLQCHDIDIELESLKLELKNLNRRIESSLDSSKSQLRKKQEENKRVEASRDASATRLEALEKEMREKKEGRNIVRAV